MPLFPVLSVRTAHLDRSPLAIEPKTDLSSSMPAMLHHASTPPSRLQTTAHGAQGPAVLASLSKWSQVVGCVSMFGLTEN